MAGGVRVSGLQSDTFENLDALLSEWAANSDEAFIACVARHGVIVLHKAYGTRDGQPMTTTTQSPMASTTKLLAGTAMTMVLDLEQVDLYDPIDKFLPEFAGIEVENPATIRDLYTHSVFDFVSNFPPSPNGGFLLRSPSYGGQEGGQARFGFRISPSRPEIR